MKCKKPLTPIKAGTKGSLTSVERDERGKEPTGRMRWVEVLYKCECRTAKRRWPEDEVTPEEWTVWTELERP